MTEYAIGATALAPRMTSYQADREGRKPGKSGMVSQIMRFDLKRVQLRVLGGSDRIEETSPF